jgi:hypothetical protein
MTLPNFDKAETQGLNPYLAIHQPNIQFKHYVNHTDAIYKTVDVAISITNLLPELAETTVNRLFTYILECVASDLNPTVTPPVVVTVDTTQSDSGSQSTTVAEYLQPIIHCELDMDNQIGQELLAPTTPGGLGSLKYTSITIANIDILIGNLQTTLLGTTFARMKTYLTTALTTDMNPSVRIPPT